MVLEGLCFVLGLFGLARWWFSLCVDVYAAATGEKSSVVSPLPKPGQLLAVLKVWEEKFGEGADFAFRVLLAVNKPSLRLEGGWFINFFLIPYAWCMNNLLLLFHPFSPKAKDKIKTTYEMWNLLVSWKKWVSLLMIVQQFLMWLHITCVILITKHGEKAT